MPHKRLIDGIFRIYEELLKLNAKKYPTKQQQQKKTEQNTKQTQPINKWDVEWNRPLWEGKGDP